jgi:putative transposase
VKRAEDYSWSSARAHVYGVKDILLSDRDLPLSIDNWASFLLERDDEQEIERFKKHEGNGRPLGDELFIQNLERMTGRLLSPQKPGRKKRTGSRPRQ